MRTSHVLVTVLLTCAASTAGDAGRGYVLRLGEGGKKLLSVSRVAGEVRDMALDGEGNGKDGFFAVVVD